MDQNGDDIPTPEPPFSYQWLLCGDDWYRWDTYPTVDTNLNLTNPTVEMSLDAPRIESDPNLPTLTSEEAVQLWLQSLTNEQLQTPSLDEVIERSSNQVFEISSNQVFEISPNVDTFTYEELLDLTEQIGDVCTGLTGETIDANLRRRKYEDCCGESEKCMICLHKLKCNEEASKLSCGHDFHFACIKEWLMVKNLCPLCKQRAL